MSTTSKTEGTLFLDYSFSSTVDPSVSDTDYLIKQVTAEIKAYDLRSSTKTDTAFIGKIGFYIIQVGTAINKGYPLSDVFDFNDKLSQLGNFIYENNFDSLNQQFLSAFPEAFSFYDIIYFDYAFVVKEARGSRILPPCVYQVLLDFGSGCSFAFSRPFPLQFYAIPEKALEGFKDLGLNSFTKDRTDSTNDLIKYFCSFGFKEIPLTEFVAVGREDIEENISKENFQMFHEFPISLFEKFPTS